MKFALVCLIAICAIAAQGSSAVEHNYDHKLTSFKFHGRDGLVDKLRELIDAIIQSVQTAIDAILREAQEIIDTVLEKVTEIVDKAQAALEKTLKKILDKLEEIAKQNETARKCVDANRPALEAAVQQAQEKLEKCNKNAVDQSKNILNDIENEIDAVHENIDALNNVINDCLETSSNPLEVAICVTKKSNEIRENTLELIKNARHALEAGASRATEIVREANSCVAKTVSETQDKLDSIMNDIQKCIDANDFNLKYLNF